MHLVGFIIRIYHDARSSECQTVSFIANELPVRRRSVQLQIGILINCPLYCSTVVKTFEKSCTAHLTDKDCSASYWVLVNVESVAGARN